ncbi:MAG: hypothetical protein FWC93_05115 [Defluviitaleaceae bacterium]|nr:hypothetical protein [Defluviitaleaceae bacterium]
MLKLRRIGKRIISMALCVALLAPLGATPAAAAHTEPVMNFNTIKHVVDEYGIVVLDISELDGKYIYFHRDGDYVTVVSIRPAIGAVNIFLNDGAGLLTYDSMHLEDLGLELVARASDNASGTLVAFGEIMDLLAEESLYLSNSYVIFEDIVWSYEIDTYDMSFMEPTYQAIQPLTHPVITHPFTINEMRRLGHSRSGLSVITSLTERGHTARLYGSSDFRVISSAPAENVLAGWAVDRIAGILGIFSSHAATMFSWVAHQTLGWVLNANFNVTRYRMSVDYARIATVRGLQLTRGDRQMEYLISFGERGAGATRSRATVYGPTMPGWPHPVFYQPTFLMQQAITIAIQNGM